MALETIVQLLDDIDGKPAQETVTFALDGLTYEIDLSAKNADKLRKTFTPYVDKARKADTRRRTLRSGVRAADDRQRAADIRAWARQHGISVNERGRIPTQVAQAYESNDPAKAKEAAPKIPQPKFQAADS